MAVYPTEHYIKLENEPYYMGRITLYQVGNQLHSDIDIVHQESQKIFYHVGRLSQNYQENDLLQASVQKLSFFLKSKME